MSIENLKNALPEYAKDLKLNLGSVVESNVLSEKWTWSCLLASALASRSAQVEQEIMAEASQKLDEKELAATKIAAAIMGMNNIYYRFLHLTKNEAYKKMPAGLRMNMMKQHGADEVMFELASLAVSAINACDMCVDAHERNLRQHDVVEEQIQAVVKIAAVVHAVSVTLEAETALGESQSKQQAA